jgi:hypothetical protein
MVNTNTSVEKRKRKKDIRVKEIGPSRTDHKGGDSGRGGASVV